MKLFSVASVLALLSVVSTDSVQPNANGKIVGGAFAYIASLPIAGPLWINAAVSSNVQTDTTSIPGYLPVAIETSEAIWGSKATIPIQISYIANPMMTAQAQTKVGLFTDNNMLWDVKISAIELNNRGAPNYYGSTRYFTRHYNCHTGDRIVPDLRAYLFVKVRGGVKADIMSDRFTTFDNRLTSVTSGAYFKITCDFIRDDTTLPVKVRQESIDHSDAAVREAAAFFGQFFAGGQYQYGYQNGYAYGYPQYYQSGYQYPQQYNRYYMQQTNPQMYQYPSYSYGSPVPQYSIPQAQSNIVNTVQNQQQQWQQAQQKWQADQVNVQRQQNQIQQMQNYNQQQTNNYVQAVQRTQQQQQQSIANIQQASQRPPLF